MLANRHPIIFTPRNRRLFTSWFTKAPFPFTPILRPFQLHRESLTREYQEHAGAVGNNTLYVGYDYADADHGLRLEAIRYPNGRLLHYTYGDPDSDADILNRLDAICDDDGGNPGQVLASYTYLGLDTIVVEDYQEAGVKLDLWGGTPGSYQGLDRFGRVACCKDLFVHHCGSRSVARACERLGDGMRSRGPSKRGNRKSKEQACIVEKTFVDSDDSGGSNSEADYRIATRGEEPMKNNSDMESGNHPGSDDEGLKGHIEILRYFPWACLMPKSRRCTMPKAACRAFRARQSMLGSTIDDHSDEANGQ